MTREELDSTFIKYKPTLMRIALKRCNLQEDAEDRVMDAYITACGRDEYKNVPTRFIRSWWCYQVRDEIEKFKAQVKEEEKALSGLTYDPTIEREYKSLSTLEALQILEEQWDKYGKSKQSRIRQQWEQDGIPILECMKRRGNQLSYHP